MYVSEITRFIEALKAENPRIVADQARGRAIWWDKKPQTSDEAERVAESRVPQPGYVYQTNFK